MYTFKFIGLFLATLLSATVYAQSIPLQQLTDEDVKNLVKETSANFNHTSVSGASSLGTLWGFELGLVGGMTKTPKIQTLVHRAEPSTKADQIPHGELIGRLTVPAGVTVEAGFIPKIGKEDFKFQTISLAAMFTPTEVFLDWPLSVAAKLHMTKTDLNFRDDVGGPPPVDTKFDYKSTTTMFTLLASKDFVVVEPYLGFAFGQTKGDLDVTGSTTVFAIPQQKASAKVSGSGFLVGAELKLLIFKAGIEYSKIFDTSRFTGKLSLYF